MPSRNLSYRQLENSSIVITPKGLTDSDTDVFDAALNEGLGLEEWDDWMRWEGATVDLLPTSIELSEKKNSSASSLEIWDTGLQTSDVDIMPTSYAAGTDFPFSDAPFELEDTPQTLASSIASQSLLPLYPMNLPYSTQGEMQQGLRRVYHGFSSLTEAEARSLEGIAMPYHALSNIKIISATASLADSQASQSCSASPEPDIRTRRNKKRKSVALDELPGNAPCQSRKRGHSAIEKRYRTNLNAKIESLREGVPSLCEQTINAGEEDSDSEADTKSGQQKYGKAAILMGALEYIQHLEKTTQRLGTEVNTLKTRVGAFEKLAMSGSIVLNGNGMEEMNKTASTNSDTLETIQSDFQQIQPKAVAVPANKRRGSRRKKAS